MGDGGGASTSTASRSLLATTQRSRREVAPSSSSHHRYLPHLVPLLSPGTNHNDAGVMIVERRLDLPGSFGRMELLKPVLSSSCRACSVVNSLNDGNKGGGGGGSSSIPCHQPPPLTARQRRKCCQTCASIKSMAKFIPRTNFLNFTYPDADGRDQNANSNNLNDEGGGRKRKWCNKKGMLLLTISGENASRLVRITSTSASPPFSRMRSSSPSLSTTTTRVVEMKVGDIISLLWHRNGLNCDDSAAMNDYPSSSAVLEPLIHYRLVWNDEEDGTIDDDETDANTIIGGDNHPFLLGLANQEDDDGEIRMTSDGGGDIQIMVDARSALSNNIGCDNDKENESEQHSDRSEEEIVRGEQPIDDMDNDSKGSCNIDHDCDANDDSEDEDESAPLTLPSRFLSSYSNSFSFDSIEKVSPSQPSANTSTVAIDIDANILNHATTKTEVECTGGETHGDNMPLMDPNISGTMDTPKKTNVTTTLRESMVSVPITSLSYDQLVQIHEEMTHPIFSATKKSSSSSSPPPPSIRHTVLSLTLALTSNVSSSYQSNTLREHPTNKRSNSKVVEMETNTSSDQKKLPQHWMPRLLLGTRFNIQNNTDIT